MKERRRAARQKSFLRGTIQFNNGRSSADCLIRDITVYGARLVCSGITTPDVIDLYIPQKDQTLRAHVIWRQAQDMGVAFAQAASAQPAEAAHDGLDLAARVERLEHELALMKKALKRIKADGQDLDVA